MWNDTECDLLSNKDSQPLGFKLSIQFETTYGIIPRSFSVVATKFSAPLLIYSCLCMSVCVRVCVFRCVPVSSMRYWSTLTITCSSWCFSGAAPSGPCACTHTHTHTSSHLRITQHAHNNTNSKHTTLYRVTSVGH